MQKIKILLLTTTLVASANTVSATSHFKGTFVGAQVGASKASATVASTNSSKIRFSTLGGYRESKKWDINGGVLVGHRTDLSSQYVAGATLGVDMESTKFKNSISTNTAEGKAQRRVIVNALGQLGYNVKHNLMPFVTLGLSYAQMKYTNSDAFGSMSKFKNKLGWAAGAGISHAFTSKLSSDIQYLYTKYSRTTGSGKTSDWGNIYTTSNPRAYHAVTLGVKVKI